MDLILRYLIAALDIFNFLWTLVVASLFMWSCVQGKNGVNRALFRWMLSLALLFGWNVLWSIHYECTPYLLTDNDLRRLRLILGGFVVFTSLGLSWQLMKDGIIKWRRSRIK